MLTGEPIGEMNHRYIDDHDVAQRYIANRLNPEERVAFETHLVDCQECTDRVLLAGMFHSRLPVLLPPHAKIAARLKTWQIAALFAVTIVLLVAIPTLLVPLLLRWLH